MEPDLDHQKKPVEHEISLQRPLSLIEEIFERLVKTLSVSLMNAYP